MYRPTFVAVVRIVPGDGHLSPLCKGAACDEPHLYVVILSFYMLFVISTECVKLVWGHVQRQVVCH